MSEIWKPQLSSIYMDWITMIIADTNAANVELTNWEKDFITSMHIRIIMKKEITELQAQKLESIYVKYTN